MKIQRGRDGEVGIRVATYFGPVRTIVPVKGWKI